MSYKLQRLPGAVSRLHFSYVYFIARTKSCVEVYKKNKFHGIIYVKSAYFSLFSSRIISNSLQDKRFCTSAATNRTLM